MRKYFAGLVARVQEVSREEIGEALIGSSGSFEALREKIPALVNCPDWRIEQMLVDYGFIREVSFKNAIEGLRNLRA